MAANLKTVSFTDPTAIIAPDLTVQQAQLARQQALADALREQSLAPIDAGGGRVSWTQGLAKLAQAYTARSNQKQIDQQQTDLARQYADRMRGMFGGTSSGAATPPIAPMPGGGTPIAPGGSPTFGSDMAAALKQYGGVNPNPASQPSAQSAPEPSPGVPLASGGGASQPGPWQMPGMSPDQSMASYMLAGPEKYGDAFMAAHAPTDFAKNLIAQGLVPGTPAYEQAMAGYNRKQSFIDPTNVREGGAVIDNNDPSKPILYAPHVPEGYQPVRNAQGVVTSIAPVPGGPQAVQNNAAAKAFGGAAGDLVQRYNPVTQQMEYVPKTEVLTGGPTAAGPSLGASAAADVTGKNSANAFQAISDGAADVPNRIYALKQMTGLVADPKTVLGPGSETWNKVRGTLATLTGGSAPSTTNAQEFNKWASQYSARSAAELGLSGSDARMNLAVHATPNGEMTKDALRGIIPQMVGIENAKQGYANAAAAWQQAHGPQSVQDFRTAWNKVYDPQIYTLIAQGPQAFAGTVARMPKAQAAQFRQKYLALKQIGALPQ